MTIQHHKYMQYAISMANRIVGNTAPNPAVGCVIVKNGIVLAASHTQKGGRPHAEVIALKEASNNAIGATAYVTLEPCAHHGKTPPCADALIKAGIKTVVIANIDPYEKVNGAGIIKLKEAGIEVITDICTNEAKELNLGFFSVIRRTRPFVTLKTATSLDGKIALKNGKSKWITNEQSRNYVHLIRARNDAIITGIATVMSDNPILSCRLPGLEDFSPIRIVLDTNLSIPTESNLVRTANQIPFWVVTLEETIVKQQDKVNTLANNNVKLIKVNKASNGKICLEDTMLKLAANGINNVMIEAGTSINSAALHLNLVDRINWFTAPIIIGNEGIPAFAELNLLELSSAKGFKIIEERNFCDDKMIVFQSKEVEAAL